MRVRILVLLFFTGCTYDYSALEKRAIDAGSPGSGNASAGGRGMFTTPDAGADGKGASGGSGTIFILAAGGSNAANGGAQSGAAGTGGSGAVGGIGAGGAMAANGGAQSGAAGRGTGAAGAIGAGGGVVGGGGGAGGEARGAAGHLGATGGGTAGAGGGTGPMILSIDFVGGLPAAVGAAGIVAAPTLRSTDVAGAKPAAHWNSASGPAGVLPSLTLSDGTLSATKLTWSSPPTAVTAPGVWRIDLSDARPDAIMMDGYLDPTSSTLPATVIVTNLPESMASVGYDVYVYCWGAIALATETRTYKYTIGATSISVSQSGPTQRLFAGFQMVAQNNGTGNYVVFHNVTGTAFSLIATPVTGDFKRAPVNGIQIVSPP